MTADGCVFVYDDPSGTETFAVGIYVDNLQIVHSAQLNSDGDAIDPNSYYAKFMIQLRKDWDVVDEGPMEDLLGIECTTNLRLRLKVRVTLTKGSDRPLESAESRLVPC